MTQHYEALQRELAQGWNTWNTRSVLSHVLLPEGFALNLALKEYASRKYLKEAFIGQRGEEVEQIHPGPRAYDGTYTELTLAGAASRWWCRAQPRGDDLVLLVTPKSTHRRAPLLVVEPGILWNRPGYVTRQADRLEGHFQDLTVVAYGTGRSGGRSLHRGANTLLWRCPWTGPSVSRRAGGGASTEIQAILRAAPIRVVRLRDILRRPCRCLRGGADLPGVGHRLRPRERSGDLAGQPALEHRLGRLRALRLGHLLRRLHGRDRQQGPGLRQRDRDHAREDRARLHPQFRHRHQSQEPRPFAAPCRIAWSFARSTSAMASDGSSTKSSTTCWSGTAGGSPTAPTRGSLCWGSDPYAPLADAHWEVTGVNERLGAALESGLDNSPMYDDVPFDDRDASAAAARMWGSTGCTWPTARRWPRSPTCWGKQRRRPRTARPRRRRARRAEALWDEQRGIFLNRRTDTGRIERPSLAHQLLRTARRCSYAGTGRTHDGRALLQPRRVLG